MKKKMIKLFWVKVFFWKSKTIDWAGTIECIIHRNKIYVYLEFVTHFLNIRFFLVKKILECHLF